ncbi:putative metallopeptidase [Candidatus Undinarchaeota archaeon]
MTKLELKKAPNGMKMLLDDMIAAIPEFDHIDPERVHLIISNSESRAIALCHEMSKRIQFALDAPPNYVIELVERNWKKLDAEQRAKVMIHELYHIPKTFSGHLRNHNRRKGFCSYARKLEDGLYYNYIHEHPSRDKSEVLALVKTLTFSGF